MWLQQNYLWAATNHCNSVFEPGYHEIKIENLIYLLSWSLQLFSQDYNLTYHNTPVVYVSFIHA